MKLVVGVSELCGYSNAMVFDLPSVRSCLQEQGDIASCNNLGGHADDETNHAHAYRANNVPELLSVVSKYAWSIASISLVNLTFSWNLSELYATHTEKMQENTHGGALMSRVGT